MTLTKMVILVAAIGIGATSYLSILAEVGLGDFSGDSHAAENPAAAAPTQAAAPSQSANGGLTIAAKDTKFDETKLSAPAGEVTIAFDNKDAQPHNLDILNGDKAGADSLAKTKIEMGPATATLSVQLKPGKYYYQCDVHPDQMHGILTVT